jgi:hypothetical protein
VSGMQWWTSDVDLEKFLSEFGEVRALLRLC